MISLSQPSLKNGLRFLQKAIPSKPQLPILSSVLLRLKDRELTLAATDLYLGVKTKVPVKTDQEFCFLVRGDVFKDMIYSFKSDQVKFKLEEKKLLLKSGTSEVTTPIQDSDEYPDFPQVDGEQYQLSAPILAKIKKYASFAASSDQARPVLTAVMFRFLKQELEVVTTDGFRLSMLSFPQVKNQVESERLLIPIKAFLEVCRIAEQTEAEQVELQVSQELKQVKFQIKQTEVYVRLIDGDYPPYEKIIPDSYKISLALEADKIKQELQRAHILAKQTSNIVRLKIADGAIDIRASSPSFGEYQGQVLIDDKEVEAEIAFNANYLLDFLSGTKPEKITFNMNESLKPAMFAVDDVEDFIYVVMPFRVNE